MPIGKVDEGLATALPFKGHFLNFQYVLNPLPREKNVWQFNGGLTQKLIDVDINRINVLLLQNTFSLETPFADLIRRLNFAHKSYREGILTLVPNTPPCGPSSQIYIIHCRYEAHL